MARKRYAPCPVRLLPLFVLALASAATSCAPAVIYACGPPANAAVVDVRAPDVDGYDLEIVHADGPGGGSTFCSAPAYEIEQEATLIELGAGDYRLLAKAEDAAIPYAFPLRGEVVVEPNRCYVPGMTCDAGARPDALTCRLILKTTACSSHLGARRVAVPGMRGC